MPGREPSLSMSNPWPRRVGILLGVVAAGVLLALAVSALTGTPPAAAPSASTGAGGSSPTKTLTLLTDGWSAKILSEAGATITPGADQVTGSGGQSAPLTFTPSSSTDIAGIARTHPAVLTRVAARMVTDDPNVRCDAGGCTYGGGTTLSAAGFAHAGHVDVFGDSYDRYHITSLIYQASVAVDSDDTAVTLSAPGWPDTVLTLQDGLGSAHADAPGSEPAAGLGSMSVGDNTYLVAAGLGRIFALDPPWLGAAGTRVPATPRNLLGGTATDPAAVPTDWLTQVVNGLPVAAPALGQASSAWMTTLTSPVTGCYLGVTCTPVAVRVSVHDGVGAAERFPVCSTRGPDTISAVYTDTLVTVTFPEPTAQAGAFGGATLAELPGYGDTSGPYRGAHIPLVTGEQTLRYVTVAGFGSDGTTLGLLYGKMFQGGADGPDALTAPVPVADIITGASLKRC